MPSQTKRVIVLGAAPEARQAVQELAALGYGVSWVPLEKLDLPCDLPPGVMVRPGAELEAIEGHAGAFTALVRQGGRAERLSAAAVLIAVGNAREYPQERYGLPLGPRVLTTVQAHQGLFAERPLSAAFALRNAHFLILLDWHGETSRETALEALYLARDLRQCHAEVTLFYRDLKVDSAPLERLTREMRAGGVVFCRYEEIEVRIEEEGIHLSAPDGPVQGDFLILPEVVKPHPTTAQLARVLQVRVGEDGYFQAINVRHYRPGLSNRKGIYVAGRCHLDADLPTALEDVTQVVASLDAFLRTLDQPQGEVAVVERDRCIRCLTCVRTCPHAAVEVVECEGLTAAYVEKAACWGCGLCAAHCPVQAISMESQVLPKWLNASPQGAYAR